MSQMPAGQYLHGDSLLHKADPFGKLLCFFALLAAILLTDSPLGYLLTAGCVFAIIRLSRIGLQAAFAALWRLWVFFLIIFLMNALFFEAENALFRWGIFNLSKGGMMQGANVVLRVMLVMVCATVLTAVTPPMKLTAAIETLLSPLQLLRIPTGEIAMILGVALQFIPTLIEEAETIKKAQMARGAMFAGERLRDRAAAVMPLVVPVFLAAFRRADALSTAMEARGYRGAKRKKRKKMHLRHQDGLCLALCCGLCLIQLFL